MAIDYYTTVTRSMLGFSDEVGPKPFILFQYYLTWSTAPTGIHPSLETIARDLRMFDRHGKPAKSAVSNLNKILVDKKWIIIRKGEVFPIKSFRISEWIGLRLFIFSELLSEILKGHSEILNALFRISERSFRNSERSSLKEEDLKSGKTIEYKNLENEDKESSSFSNLEPDVNSSPGDDNIDSPERDPNEKNRQTEVPLKKGEGGLNDSTNQPKTPGSVQDKRKAQVPLSGDGSDKNREIKQKQRKDLSTENWLVWLKEHPDYQGINILGKYREMLDWSKKSGQTATRRRLIVWLENERDSMPVDFVPKEENTNGTGEKSGSTGNTGKPNNAHLKPRGIGG